MFLTQISLIILSSLFYRALSSNINCTNIFLNNTEGIITSPNYPNNYPNSTSCSWFINIPKNHILSVSIVDVNIEEDDDVKDCRSNDGSSNCCSNWLSVSSYDRILSKIICGDSPVPIFILPSSLKKITIKFHSELNTKGYNGFKLKYALALEDTCKHNEFKCVDGTDCINKKYRCDGIIHCNDNSDEIGCPNRCYEDGLSACEYNDEFICYNASLSVCAIMGICPTTSKNRNLIACKDGKLCYNKSSYCDNIINCKDESDESTECNKDLPDVYYMCDNWKLIPTNKVCDGTDDCKDDSDEQGCVKPSLETAIILGCLSCSLLFILLASYTYHAHQQQQNRQNQHQHRRNNNETSHPRIRPSLFSYNAYLMPFREPPPPYPFDPPVANRRRYRRHGRRHTRSNTTPITPTTIVSEPVENIEEEQPIESPEEQQQEDVDVQCTEEWKESDEHQECSTSGE